MKHKGTVTLETDRLILRRFSINDINEVFINWASDTEVSKYARQQTHVTIDDTKCYLNEVITDYSNINNYYWAIILKSINEPIGRINITGVNEPIESVHISFMIGKKWWNKGYATESLSVVLRFLFEDVGVNRIEGRNDIRNLSSEKVMLKCGFQYEGLLRQGGRNSFGLVDCKQYAIIAEDYKNII